MPDLDTIPELKDYVNVWIRNDATPSFQGLRMNSILNALADLIANAGGLADGNNYPTGLTFSGGTLTQTRFGLSSLSTTINKAGIGLGNVDNTSDATKWAASAVLTNKIIDGGSNTISGIPVSALSPGTNNYVIKTVAGVVVWAPETGGVLPVGGTVNQALTKNSSTDGDAGWETIDKTFVGLGNVDNTTDLLKPISTATQTALDLKAFINNPTFTGIPAAPTAAPGTNTTQLATTAFVQAAVSAATTGVASFAGRTGIVVPVTNDYTWAQIDKTVSSLADLTTRSAGHLSSGTLPDARLSSNVVMLTGAQTLTDKTLTSPILNYGSDATGDTYYRGAGGVLIRVPIGTNGQVWKIAAGVPGWGTDTSGGTLADGDYTDITISGSGTVFTIKPNAVTTAKIQDLAITTAKIDGLAVTNAKINDVAWSKITGTPTTLAGYGITDAMGLNVTNSMGTNGRIVFSTATSDSSIKAGFLEMQGVNSTLSILGHNAYYNAGNILHRATGGLTYLELNDTSVYVKIAASATAGSTATVTVPFGITAAGVIVGIANGYVNFNSVSGTTGYGFRDNGGTMQWKNAGGAWADIATGGGGGGVTDGDKTDITVSGSGTVWTIDNNAITTAKINALAVTNAKINDLDAAKLTGYLPPATIFGTATDGYVPKMVSGVIVWQPDEIGAATTLTSTQIAFGDGSNLVTSSANFKWDNTNQRISVGNFGTRNINVNATQPTFGWHQSGTEKMLMGVSNATDALVVGSALSDPVIKWTADKKLIFSDDGDKHLNISFADEANTIYGSAAVFSTDTSVISVGHGNTPFIFQQKDSGNSGRIGWINHSGDFMGEIGPNNSDGNFALLINAPSNFFIYGWHPEVGTDAPLVQMLPDGTVTHIYSEDGGSNINVGLWDYKNNRYIFGDATNTGGRTLQVHGNGEIGTKGVQPIVFFNATGLTQPFAFADADQAGKVGTLSATLGGLLFQGLSSGDNHAIRIQGLIGSNTPTNPAIIFEAYKKDATTGLTTLAAAEKVFSLKNNATEILYIRGDGRHVTNTGAEGTGKVWTWNASGYADWATAGGGGSSSLTATYIGFGDGSNVLTGDADLTYIAADKQVISNGPIKFTNGTDAFLASQGVIAAHSNNFMYAQGIDAGGFIFRSGTVGSEQLQLRALDNSMLFYVNNATRMWIKSTGNVEITSDLVKMQTANSGVFFQELTSVSSFFAIYPDGITPGAGNYAFITKNDATSTFINSITTAGIAVSGAAKLTATSSGITISNLAGSGAGVVAVDNAGLLSFMSGGFIALTGTSTLTGDITIAGGATNTVNITGSEADLFKITQSGAGNYGLTIDALEYGATITAGVNVLTLINDNTTSNSIVPAIRSYRNGVNAANGAGISNQYYIKSSAGNTDQSAELIFKLTDATDGSEDCSMEILLQAAGATAAVKYSLESDGTANMYGGINMLNIGTVPSTNLTNGIRLYAEDVAASSELKVRDEAGNITTLSPHNFTKIPQGPSEEMAWAYYSEKDGKFVNVDMLKLARIVEREFGVQLVYTGKL